MSAVAIESLLRRRRVRGRGRDTIENQDFELIEKKDMSHEPRSGSAESVRRHVLAARSARR